MNKLFLMVLIIAHCTQSAPDKKGAEELIMQQALTCFSLINNQKKSSPLTYQRVNKAIETLYTEYCNQHPQAKNPLLKTYYISGIISILEELQKQKIKK